MYSIYCQLLSYHLMLSSCLYLESRGINFDMNSMRMHLRDIFKLDDLIADYNNGTTQHNAIQQAMRMITIHTYTYWVMLRVILVMISW